MEKKLKCGRVLRMSILFYFLFLFNVGAFAQGTFNVTGVVTADDTNEPLFGAIIMEQGTNNGVAADVDGRFSLNVKGSASVLAISYMGYHTAEITVGNQNYFPVRLKVDLNVLGDVVVIGFGTQKKANLTGALSSINMEDVLGNRPVVSTPQALQGAAPGLQVTVNTGKPGTAMDLNIRGTNRLNVDGFGTGSPLVLADNVPVDINMIAPGDIESVTILKDAASAAIYGARAAFGVILITTKQAKKGQKARINYNNNFAFTKPQALIQKANPLETVSFYRDLNSNDTYTFNSLNIDEWLGYLKDYQTNPDKYPNGNYFNSAGTRFDLREVNHVERMMDDYGFQQTHNISVDGGTEKTVYRLSFGYLNEDGILITGKDKYDRYNVSSFISTDVTNWFTAQVDVKYANSTQTEPNMVSLRSWNAYRLAQLLPTYYPEGDVEVNGKTVSIGTPSWNIENSPKLTTKNQDIRLFGKAIFKPFDGMLVNFEYTFNRTDRHVDTYNKVLQYVNAEKAYAVGSTHGGTSSYRKDNYAIDYTAINIYGNYDKSFGDHNLSLMAGYNQEYRHEKSFWAQRTGVNDNIPSITGADLTQTVGDNEDEYAIRGGYYRVSYNYKGRYLIETNGRYDGSSKFPKGHRFGFFPSVSAGWRISDESFMDWSDQYLDNLKFRVSYGQIGNQAIANYAFIGKLYARNGWLNNTGTWNMTYSTPNLFSSNFTWEKVNTLDFGFDLDMFKNRLEVVFDWYQRDTKDMLAPSKTLPAVLGGDEPFENSADIRTKGWELTVNWRHRIGRNWRYGIGFNIYDSQSEVTKFDNPDKRLADYYVGQKIGEFWGLVTDRYYTTDDFLVADDAAKTYTLKEGVPYIGEIRIPRPGDILYKDLNNSGMIDYAGDNTVTNPGDRKIIGNSTRRYNYSINANVGWKGFDLSVFFQGVGKRDVRVDADSPSAFLMWPHSNVDNPDAAATVLKHHLDYWTPDNLDAFYPRLGNQTNSNQGTDSYNRRLQSKYLMNGAYIKLKNITLSYSLPQSWLEKTKVIQSAKLFFSGEDLWTKHHLFEGMDPEQTFRVNDLYPFMKKYSFGLNITL